MWKFVTVKTGCGGRGAKAMIIIYFISCLPIIYFFLGYNSLSSIFHECCADEKPSEFRITCPKIYFVPVLDLLFKWLKNL